MSEFFQLCEPGETPIPHAQDASPAIGIDLGTTHSVVAISTQEKAEILRDDQGNGLLPSVVAYGVDQAISVGSPARHGMATGQVTGISSVKRLMGRSRQDIVGHNLEKTFPLAAEEAPLKNQGDVPGMVRLQVGSKAVTPVEISAQILKSLKEKAETSLGKAVTQAVITVPAYFDDAARTATRDAAKLAGLETLRLINEPTAAALAYGLDKKVTGAYAVYDFGGGTFDFSVLKLEKGVFQVLATGGDLSLGGDDVDHLILDAFMAGRQASAEDPSPHALQKALLVARAAKEAVSQGQEDGHWTLNLCGQTSTHTLTRSQLDALCQPLIEKTLSICDRVLEDAALTPGEVEGVVLVGGSTRLPLVAQALEVHFSAPPLQDIHPDEAVALGAALQAEALTRGSSNLLLDVTPLSLGLETMGGLVEKLIPRNSPIPASQAQEFTTFQDGQTALLIHVVQGERETVSDCRSLARFELQDIPPLAAGCARIQVTFTVDADGLLTVQATEATTGTLQRIEIKPSYGLTEEALEDMLRAGFENAEADHTHRLLMEARVEAERLLQALRSAIRVDGDLLSEAERSELEDGIKKVEKALESSERDVLTNACEALEKACEFFAQRRMEQGLKKALTGTPVDALKAKGAPKT